MVNKQNSTPQKVKEVRSLKERDTFVDIKTWGENGNAVKRHGSDVIILISGTGQRGQMLYTCFCILYLIFEFKFLNTRQHIISIPLTNVAALYYSPPFNVIGYISLDLMHIHEMPSNTC